MFLKKEKESRVKRKSAFEQLRPVTRASKTKCSIYTPDALEFWQTSPPITSIDTEPYNIFWKRSYNDTQFK